MIPPRHGLEIAGSIQAAGKTTRDVKRAPRRPGDALVFFPAGFLASGLAIPCSQPFAGSSSGTGAWMTDPSQLALVRPQIERERERERARPPLRSYLLAPPSPHKMPHTGLDPPPTGPDAGQVRFINIAGRLARQPATGEFSGCCFVFCPLARLSV